MLKLSERVQIPRQAIPTIFKSKSLLSADFKFEEFLGGFKSINLNYQEQKQTEWCWTTCAAMVGEYCKNETFQQCKFASDLYNLICCDTTIPNGCNRPCLVNDVVTVYSRISVASTLVNNPIPFTKIEEEIAAGRPVEAGIAWNAGSGHVMLISGTDNSSGKQYVQLKDPWPTSKNGKTGTVLYDDLLVAFGRGKWKWTWIGIA